MPVFKVEEEMGYDGGLIPEGTLVMCEISVPNPTPKKSDNDSATSSLDIELTVCDGQYSGSRFYDRIGVTGKDAYVTMGKQKVMYALEASRQSHKTGDYELETWGTLNGMKILVKVGVEVYYSKKQSKWAYKNVSKAFGSPRVDSRNFKYWESYARGDQPFQTDKLPPILQAAPNDNNAQYGNVTGHLEGGIGF